MQNNHVITYETTINASLEKVWEALTNPDIVKKYFFGSELESTYEVGTPIYFRGDWEGKSYEDKGIIKEYTANKSLTYSYLSNWSELPDEEDNYLMVRYEISPAPIGTKLLITQSNYDAEKAAHSLQNWEGIIGEMKRLIE